MLVISQFRINALNNRLVAVEDEGHALQGAAAGFGIPKVDIDEHDENEAEEYGVELLADLLQPDRVHEGLQDTEERSQDLRNRQAAGAQRVRPNLAGIRNSQGHERNVVPGIVDEYHGHGGEADRQVARFTEGARQRRDHDVADEHDGRAEQE